MAITIKFDLGKLSKELKKRARVQYPKAAVAAINRTAQGAFTRAVRAVQKDVGASSQKSIRRDLFIRKATVQKPQAEIEARSPKKHKLPIFELGPQPRRVTRRRPPGGVRYGPNRKLLPGSFIARLSSGHVGVFARFAKKRLPIKELKGPSVALVFSRRKIKQAIREFIKERIPIEMSRAFRRFGG